MHARSRLSFPLPLRSCQEERASLTLPSCSRFPSRPTSADAPRGTAWTSCTLAEANVHLHVSAPRVCSGRPCCSHGNFMHALVSLFLPSLPVSLAASLTPPSCLPDQPILTGETRLQEAPMLLSCQALAETGPPVRRLPTFSPTSPCSFGWHVRRLSTIFVKPQAILHSSAVLPGLPCILTPPDSWTDSSFNCNP